MDLERYPQSAARFLVIVLAAARVDAAGAVEWLEKLRERLARWQAPAPRYATGVFAKSDPGFLGEPHRIDHAERIAPERQRYLEAEQPSAARRLSAFANHWGDSGGTPEGKDGKFG
jgi:hypothetical protein